MGWLLGIGIPVSLITLWVVMGSRVGKLMALRNKQYNQDMYPNICFRDGEYQFKGEMKFAFVMGVIFWPACWIFLKINDILDPLVDELRTPEEQESYIEDLERKLGYR